jgi:hypothetical protein
MPTYFNAIACLAAFVFAEIIDNIADAMEEDQQRKKMEKRAHDAKLIELGRLLGQNGVQCEKETEEITKKPCCPLRKLGQVIEVTVVPDSPTPPSSPENLIPDGKQEEKVSTHDSE